MYKVMYLGQKPIGEKCLSILDKAKGKSITIGAIVSNSERESVWWKSNNCYQYALEHNVPFIGNEHRNSDEIRKYIIDESINFLISVGHNWIIDEEILRLVGGNAINLHLAILPSYQGNYSFNHAILNHDTQYAITIHWMQKEVDTGDYVMMPKFEMSSKDTAYSLYQKSIDMGVNAFGELINMMNDGIVIPRNKMIGESRFYSRNSLEGKRKINSINDDVEIDTKARAFYFPPFERAYCYINQKKYYIEPEDDGL